jgi:hypothetical protein
MPNRHEIFQLKPTSQPVRIRHFGGHKCREPAISAQVDVFRISENLGNDLRLSAIFLIVKVRAFSIYGHEEIARNGFAREYAARAGEQNALDQCFAR